MNPAQIKAFFTILRRQNPAPKTELNFVNAYTLLVAVVLSAQATDTGVNRATRLLFKDVRAPSEMVKLGLTGLKKHICTIGLFNTKAKNIIALSKLLIEKHNGRVPQTLEDLMALPGVGRKTANVILNAVFNQPTIAVDTHVFRVCNRTGLAPGRGPEEVEEGLMRVVPKNFQQHAHHWLILHGRYTCRARKPLCAACAVRDYCDYPDKT